MKKTRKVIISIIAILAMVCTAMCLTVFAGTSFSGGKGTAADPYIITKADQLGSMENKENVYYKLGEDISVTTNDLAVILAKGSVFDGAGHKVTYQTGSKAGYPIFAQNNGTIKNLKVAGSDRLVAGIVILNNGKVYSCANTCNVSATEKSLSSSTPVDMPVFAGGLVGMNSGSIYDCYNTGKVSATSASTKTNAANAAAGGIVGVNQGSTMNHCYNVGAITASSTKGTALADAIGCKYNATASYVFTSTPATYCYYLKTVSSSKGSQGKTQEEMEAQETYDDFSFGSVWGFRDGDFVYPELRAFFPEVADPVDPEEPTPEQPADPEDPSDRNGTLVRYYGDTRYGTAYEIADQMKAVLGVNQFDNLILVYSQNYPDALSASYLAAQKNAPILLVDSKGHEGEQQFLDYAKKNLKLGGTLYVVGGDAVITNSYYSKLMDMGKEQKFNVKKLSGKDRYETNRKVLDEAGAPTNEVIICTGENFADALSASASGRPILLVDTNYWPNTKPQLEYLEKHLGKSAEITIVGGKNAISKDMESNLVDKGFKNFRRVEGENRYQTSVNFAKAFYDFTSGAVDDVCCAWAGNFPDALCGGPLAYQLGAPLILTDECCSASLYDFLPSKIRVVGFGGAGGMNNQLTNKTMNLLCEGTIKVYHNPN